MLALNSHPHIYENAKSVGRVEVKTDCFSERHREQSEVKNKTKAFKTEIRNQQIRQFKAKRREEILKIKQIQQMMEHLPLDNSSSHFWASDFFKLYGQASNFTLTPTQAVELFWLTQKFPNKLTFQLLQIVVVKGSIQSLDELFQYDVMKLLHSMIIYSNQGSLNRSYSSEESESIIREAVMCSQTVSKIADSVQEASHYKDQLELVQIVLRIISELCRKSQYIRNFAVINHKTYTYCLKAFKQFGDDIKTQFYELLEAITKHPFRRNQEQFSRVTSKILSLVYSQRWELAELSSCDSYESDLFNLRMLLKGVKNVLSMKSSWIMIEVQLIESRNNRSLFQIVFGIVHQFNWLLVHNNHSITHVHCKLLSAAVVLAMEYVEMMESATNLHRQEDSFDSQRNSNANTQMYFELSITLREGINVSHLSEARAAIYFMLSNYCVDKEVPHALKYSLLVFDPKSPKNNLLTVLSNLLYIQTNSNNIYELGYLIHHIFEGIPMHIIQPLMIPSEVLQAMCNVIIEGDCVGNDWSIAKKMVVEGICLFVRKVEEDFRGASRSYREIMAGQFRQTLCLMVQRYNCERDLERSIEQLLYILEEGTA